VIKHTLILSFNLLISLNNSNPFIFGILMSRSPMVYICGGCRRPVIEGDGTNPESVKSRKSFHDKEEISLL
jgi:hypothetical protein